MNEERYYLDLITNFVSTGSYPKEGNGDALCEYLIEQMKDPQIQLIVLDDEVRAQIFADHLMRFVDVALQRSSFHFSRKQSEVKGMRETLEWSMQKKQDGNQALLDTLDKDYGAYGFRSGYYRDRFQTPEGLGDSNLWESLYKDYSASLAGMLEQENRRYVQENASAHQENLRNLLRSIPDYLQKKKVDKEEFKQAWGMMGGVWNEYDFERFIQLARVQQEYPVLQELANKMGHMVDPSGNQFVWVGSGKSMPLAHSAKSDIQGVTVGKSIDSLLPTEMAQMADDDLDELFLQKYTTGKLQRFLHKSEQLSPNRKLDRKRARQKGPMIVCVDTSGSMQGVPERIARSMVLRLCELSKRQDRSLFLIAFSVSARPIDAKKDRVRLLDFFARQSCGDTNATKMIQHTLLQLEENAEYMSADVLFIGDFRMPLVSASLLSKIRYHRQLGTTFYGLQIGGNPHNEWIPFLDAVLKIGYTPTRKY